MEVETDGAAEGDSESVHSDEEEGEDPCKIEMELDMLNSASDNINKLETELERAKSKFLQVKSEAGRLLSLTSRKIGRRSVRSSQPYYKILKQLNQVRMETQRSAVKYQDAHSTYLEAKDVVRQAEGHLSSEGAVVSSLSDPACQDILNKATIALFNAEKEKIACEQEHLAKASQCEEYQRQMASLFKEMPQVITKARPFYDLRDKLEAKLQIEKQNAEDLQLALVCNKQKYKTALSNLEHISEAVHERRNLRLLPPRTPGVGAEAESEFSDLPSSTLDVLSETTSQNSFEIYEDSLRKELNSRTASTHDLRSDCAVEELDSRFHASSSDVKCCSTVQTMPLECTSHREDLEGAENVHEGFTSEMANPVNEHVPHSPVCFRGTSLETEHGTSDGGTLSDQLAVLNISDVPKLVNPPAKAVVSKRMVAVRDLSKGIYVAHSVSSSNGSSKSNDGPARKVEESLQGSTQRTVLHAGKTEVPRKKLILQQFPLLQNLMGSSQPNQRTSQQKF